MELAKKSVYFLCNADAPTFKISVPKTEHPFRFERNQPELIHYELDIEFFDGHQFFDRVDVSEQPISPEESAEEIVLDANSTTSGSTTVTIESSTSSTITRQPYSRPELQKMKKSEVRDILKELAPEKSCPVRKETIISAVLKAQEPSE